MTNMRYDSPQENFLGETETLNQLNQDDIDYVADEIEQAISRRY